MAEDNALPAGTSGSGGGGRTPGAHAVVKAELAAFMSECARLEREARARGRRWEWVRVVLGLPAVVLATISGATGLSSAGARVPAALFALISACLVSASGFLRPDARNLSATQRKRAYRLLQAEARLAVVRMEAGQTPDPMAVLDELVERRKKVVAGHADQLLG